MNKKSHSLLLMISFITLIVFSCNKNEQPADTNTCGVANPVVDLPWLKSRIDALFISNPETVRYQYVAKADYRGKTVFIFGNCDPLAVSVFPVFNCSNVQLGTVGQIPLDSLKNQRTLWKTQNSLCNF